MNRIRLLIALALTITLSSCSLKRMKDYWLTDHGDYSQPSLTSFEEKLESWKGADVNQLIESWGPPTSTYDMPNGDKMYTWNRTGGTVASSNYFPQLSLATARANTMYCNTSFTVSSSNIVTNWRWEGNSCK